MVAISFSKEKFVDLIRKLWKDQTIRPYNERRFKQIRENKKLQLYYKQRTKDGFKIGDAELVELSKLRLYKPGVTDVRTIQVFEGKWRDCTEEEAGWICTRDGFANLDDMYEFFHNTYGDQVYTMEFMVIRWKLIVDMAQEIDKLTEGIKALEEEILDADKDALKLIELWRNTVLSLIKEKDEKTKELLEADVRISIINRTTEEYDARIHNQNQGWYFET